MADSMNLNLKNKNVTVVGLGKSGFAAAEFLKKQGTKARATEGSAKDSVACLAKRLVEDGIKVEIGRHTEEFLKGTDLFVTSPGVPDTAMPLKWAKENKIKVIDEIELAYRFCKAPIIAITGTNGKSTTTSLIGHILNNCGKKAVVCGNIGNPFSAQIKNLKKDDIVVLEASSFQLSRIDKFRPKVALFLNASQNHLDRHSDFDEYFNAKMRVFENQTTADWAVINYEDKNLARATKKIKAKKIFFSPDCRVAGKNYASVDKGTLFVSINKKRFDVCSVDDLKIKGRHNIENALAAISAVCVLGIPALKIREAIKTFEGLEHRCEYVATIEGVKFVNDSKSTTPDATIKALTLCEGKVILIAGGRDKNSDFVPLRGYLKDKVKTLILIGEAKEKIKNALLNYVRIEQADTLDSAVQSAFKMAEKSETVLLSPMCTSFDMFEDFQHRGRMFKDSVKRLNLCVKQG